MGVSSSSLRFACVALSATLFLASCQSVDLSAVTDLADAAQKAQPTYDAITQDYHDSCTRTQQWYALIVAEGNQPGRHRVRHAKHAAPPPSLSTCDSADIQAAIARWNAWNHLLIAYYAALGNIAARPSSNADYGIKAAAQAMQNDKLVANTPQSAQTVSDVSAAAITAVDAYFDAKRRGAVAAFANADSAGTAFVSKMTPALSSCAQDYIDLELVPERTAVDAFYNFNLDQVPAGTQILTGLHQFMKAWTDDDAAVEAKVVAAHNYMSSLDSLQQSYEAISQSIADNDPSKATGLVSLYISNFNTNLNTINQALTKTGTSK